MQICTCAVSVTDPPPGTTTVYHCSWGNPCEVVTNAGGGRAAPVDRELELGTRVESYVPLRRMVSMVASTGAEFVITIDKVETEQEEDRDAAVAVAVRMRGLVGVGRDTTVGVVPVNLTCVPEEM